MKYKGVANPEFRKWGHMCTSKLPNINVLFYTNILIPFRQYRRKYNVRFSSDKESLSYYQKQIYKFSHVASYPYSENDKIIVLNMHMNVSIFKGEKCLFKMSIIYNVLFIEWMNIVH